MGGARAQLDQLDQLQLGLDRERVQKEKIEDAKLDFLFNINNIHLYYVFYLEFIKEKNKDKSVELIQILKKLIRLILLPMNISDEQKISICSMLNSKYYSEQDKMFPSKRNESCRLKDIKTRNDYSGGSKEKSNSRKSNRRKTYKRNLIAENL